MKEYPKSQLIIYTDGGSRGNPGYAAYGFVVYDGDKNLIVEQGKNIGIATNNVAEYSAILEALKYVLTINNKPSNINFYMDSMLCAMQLSNKWKIKNENIRGFYYEIKKLEKEIGIPVTYSHVPREKNKEADRMVNMALDGLIS